MTMNERPDTNDFWLLSGQVLRRDGAADQAETPKERTKVWDDMLAETGIDPDSLIYMATQRAMRVLGITMKSELIERRGQVSALTALYIEGFQMGAEYESTTGNFKRKA